MASPTITLCMIVRDAEHTLGPALDSAKPFVDEMVIVDTGSIDKTVEIAEARNANVYHFPWIDDFSAARNESIKRATGDWIFWMDADDILKESTGNELRQSILKHPEKNVGFMLHVEEKQPNGASVSRFLHCKLFPRHPEIRFKYRIHEKISASIENLGYEIKMCDAVVQHANSDRNPESNARRIKRNRPLLELELIDHPNDGVVLFNAGYHFLITSDELLKATDLLKRSLEWLPKNNAIRITAYEMLIKAYWRAKNHAHLSTACEAALEDYPDTLIFLFNLGKVSEVQGSINTAESHYLRALNHGKVTSTSNDLIGQVVFRLGELYIRTDRAHEMESIWLKYLAMYPQDFKIRRALIETYITSNHISEAEQHIRLFPVSPQFTAIRMALSGCISVQRNEWDKAILDLTASKKMGFVDQLQLYSLSTAYMSNGKFEEAEHVLMQLLKIAPGNTKAAKNLEVVRKQINK